jgi:hypothetical protein
MGLAALALCWLTLGWGQPAGALDLVTFRQNGKQLKVAGRVLLTAQDGGMLLEGRDGVIWAIQPDEKVAQSHDDAEFAPFTQDELAQRLLLELPRGFEVYKTNHYVILHDTSRDYAQWCGSLFERLYSGFTNYWSTRGLETHEPEFPLVAIIFNDRRTYIQHSKADLGEAAESIIGFFNLKNNRMTMYDLSGTSGTAKSKSRGTLSAQIQKILSQPDAAWNVATVVHEATHQIAFNCGLHTRFSDCPRWFSEGIAMYSETPDLKNPRGWKSMGSINRPRLSRFHEYVARRPQGSLASLISNDKRFTDTENALDAYSEAWALTYFLIQKYPKQYAAYLKKLSAKEQLHWDDAATRMKEFQEAFGDLEEVDREFLRTVQRLR